MQVLFLQSHSKCFGRKRPSSGVFKTSTTATGTCVIVAGKSSHHLIRTLIWWCDDLPATITHVPVTAVPVLNTRDDGRLRPKHVEWLCRNKMCTVLHQVGISFDLYYDARKHKIKTPQVPIFLSDRTEWSCPNYGYPLRFFAHSHYVTTLGAK